VHCILRAKIVDPSGSIRSGSVYPACFASLVRRQVTMLVALADKLNTASRRATLQPPLAYCVTEFGRPFVGPTPINWSFTAGRGED
jgi:hypothetical protein